MATIAMIPIGPVTTLNRSVLKTERVMSATGGDDFICGHCGYVMLENFDPSTISGNPVYQCGICENNNDLPFSANDVRFWSSR
jgi:ribosomal protein S27AE